MNIGMWIGAVVIVLSIALMARTFWQARLDARTNDNEAENGDEILGMGLVVPLLLGFLIFGISVGVAYGATAPKAGSRADKTAGFCMFLYRQEVSELYEVAVSTVPQRDRVMEAQEIQADRAAFERGADCSRFR